MPENGVGRCTLSDIWGPAGPLGGQSPGSSSAPSSGVALRFEGDQDSGKRAPGRAPMLVRRGSPRFARGSAGCQSQWCWVGGAGSLAAGAQRPRQDSGPSGGVPDGGRSLLGRPWGSLGPKVGGEWFRAAKSAQPRGRAGAVETDEAPRTPPPSLGHPGPPLLCFNREARKGDRAANALSSLRGHARVLRERRACSPAGPPVGPGRDRTVNMRCLWVGHAHVYVSS